MDIDNRQTNSLNTVWVVAALLIGLIAGVELDRQFLNGLVPVHNVPRAAVSDFNLMIEAWNLIHNIYVDQTAVQDRTLTYAAISGMVDALGDTGHSSFLSPETRTAENNSLKGSFEGIGATVEMKNGQVTIVSPLDNSPAQAAGLRPGDIILKVNGQDTAGKSLTEVVSQIVGPAGTKVTLTIQSADSRQSRDITITRAKIVVHNVTWSLIPGTQVAHVRISTFSDGVSKDLTSALQEIRQQGINKIVLDLRNDPGGLLNESVSSASQFLSGGNVLLTRDSSGKETPVPVQAGGVEADLPGDSLIVLINRGTASASEILSGAIQDAGKGRLVGETTFGTGTVLQQYPLSDGSALLLANQEWLTPKGRVIWHKGITPDVSVTLPTTIFPLTPSAEKEMTVDQLKNSGDAQLLKGLDLLGVNLP